MNISENAEAKCSQQSVENITSLPATATNDGHSIASISNPENRPFVSELWQKNRPFNTLSCSERTHKKVTRIKHTKLKNPSQVRILKKEIYLSL